MRIEAPSSLIPPYFKTPPGSLIPPPELTDCKIVAHIVDVHSYVTISQKFFNKSNEATNTLTYTFNMLAGAAVCDFELVRESGRKIVGVVKEKEQAKKEMDAALAAGRAAADLKEETKDGGYTLGLV